MRRRSVVRVLLCPTLLFFCIFLCVGMRGTAARADAVESYVLSGGGSAVLVDTAGEVLVPAGRYAELVRLGGGYAAREAGGTLWALTDARGVPLTGFVYDSLSYDGETVVFGLNGKYGAMDMSGAVIVEAKYTHLLGMGGGRWLALKTDPLDDTPDAVLSVAADGSETAGARVAYRPEEMSEGLCAAMSESGRFGWLDADGSWAIEPRFLWAGPFRDGRAAATDGSGTGLVDRTGAWAAGPYAGRVTAGGADVPALVVLNAGGVLLVDPASGALIARFDDASDARFGGGCVILSMKAGGFLLTDFDGSALYRTDADVLSVSAAGGCVIERRAFSLENPCRLVRFDGTVVTERRELSFAGFADGEPYCVFVTCDAEKASAGGLTFYDEVSGTRRCGLISCGGQAALDGLLSLRRTDRALLTAEAEDWIGLVRPDGEIVARIEKSE